MFCRFDGMKKLKWEMSGFNLNVMWKIDIIQQSLLPIHENWWLFMENYCNFGSVALMLQGLYENDCNGEKGFVDWVVLKYTG